LEDSGILERFRARLEQVNALERHTLKKPLAKIAKIKAVAETPRRNGNEFPVTAQQMGTQCQEQGVDVRLAMDDVGHNPGVPGISPDLEVGWVRDDAIELAKVIVLLEQTQAAGKLF
jgi:hypothetical protein